jgi:heptosyltransferase-2
VTSLAEEPLSLGLSKACVRRSQLAVTTDSGPRHFAAAFGVPCVTLFGPTDPRWSWNYHPRETVLQQSLPCVPCGKRVCPLRHHACLRDLAPTTVQQVVARELARIGAEKAA